MLAEAATRDPIDELRRAANDHAETAIDAMVTALRLADELTALSIGIAARLMPTGAIERTSGVPTELVLTLRARRSAKEARLLAEAAATLRGMPATSAAFSRGDLSWDEVRLIVAAVRVPPVAQRGTIDALIGRSRETDPETLVASVFDEVARLRADLLVDREQRAIERSFLSIQPRLNGEGGSMYVEADAESLATIVEAIETAAPLPVEPEDDDACFRARQRFDGLLAVCESFLGGGDPLTRPRPRLLATVDLRDLQAGAGDGRTCGAPSDGPAGCRASRRRSLPATRSSCR